MKRLTGLDWPLWASRGLPAGTVARGRGRDHPFRRSQCGIRPPPAIGALCRRGVARCLRQAGRRDRRTRAREHSHRRPRHAAPAAAGHADFDRHLPLYLGRPRAGGGHQSIPLSAVRCRADGPARQRDLPLHQSRRLCPDDLSAGVADDLLSRHPDIRGTGGHEGRHGCVGRRGGLGDFAVARGAWTAALASPAVRMASAAAVGVRPQRAYRYRGDCLAPAGLPGDGTALADPGRHGARCRRPGQVFSRCHRSCTLQALGLAFSDCVHRDRRRSIPALCRRGDQGVRFPRPLYHRGGHR